MAKPFVPLDEFGYPESNPLYGIKWAIIIGVGFMIALTIGIFIVT